LKRSSTKELLQMYVIILNYEKIMPKSFKHGVNGVISRSTTENILLGRGNGVRWS